MKTFEDNEIIKAVECCIGNTNCGECPMFRTPNCMNKVFGYVLDLINRKDTKIAELEAEIEKLNTILPKNKDTIVILPCEIGTRIYQVIDEYDAKRNGCSRCLADFGFKTECAYYKNKDCTNLTANKHWQIISRRFELKDKDLFGEMIFLTHTEAEEKLQEINARYNHPTEKGGEQK